MGQLLERRQQIAARIGTEGGPFDPSTLAAANAAYVLYEPQINYDQTYFTRQPARATIGQLPGIPGQVLGNVTFRTDLVGSGTAGVAPTWGRFLRACGFGETVNAGSASVGSVARIPNRANGTNITPVITGTFSGSKSGFFLLELIAVTTNTSAQLRWTFVPGDGTASTFGTTTHTDATAQSMTSGLSVAINNPSSTTGWLVGDQWRFSVVSSTTSNVIYKAISSSIPCLDMAVYQDGRVHKLHSARGTASINAQIGQPAQIDWSFQGVKAENPSDLALLTGIPYPDVTPVSFIGVTSSAFSETLCFTALTIDFGNTLAPRQCANAATGYNAIRISNRAVTGSLDPEASLIADFNPWANLFNGAVGQVTVTIGTVAGNIITIDLPNAQITAIGQSSREQIIVDQLTLAAVEPEFDAGGDYSEINITVA